MPWMTCFPMMKMTRVRKYKNDTNNHPNSIRKAKSSFKTCSVDFDIYFQNYFFLPVSGTLGSIYIYFIYSILN